MVNRILVVDDDVLLVDMIEQCLEEDGYAAATTDNGEEAIFFLKTRKFDLLLRHFGADPQTKVILCSGDIVYATLSRAFACGADSFLAKPSLLNELRHRLKKCLGRESPENQGIMTVQPRATQTFGQKDRPD